MTTTELTPASETSSSSGIPAARSYLPGRRGLIAAGAVIVAAGLAFKWSWLVAAGITPVLLSVLPCVAMCALGLCMNRMVGDRPAGSNQRHSLEFRLTTSWWPHVWRLPLRATKLLPKCSMKERGARPPRSAARCQQDKLIADRRMRSEQ
jgi:hypothetical protein